MTAHTSTTGFTTAGLGRRLLAGAVGGIAGGVVFGMMMSMMGMLTTVAGMVHSTSPILGFGIHIMISIFYGLVFALLGGRWLTSWGRGLTAGAIYGVILWVLGPLIMMPLMLGGAVFSFGATTMLSLMGHLIYALILAAVAVPIARRRA